MILHYPNVTLYFHKSTKKTTWHSLSNDAPITITSSSGNFENSIDKLLFFIKSNFDGAGIPGRRVVCTDENVVVIRI